ncbi:MAG: hypothetical protein INH41_04280 [Myxococcaceae bacterium]|nr:hypothetical protein [Myxococcaceae bacterium]MCA3011600.1 hypothetical protein [Myxococcaceae bacterium]
MTGRVGAIALGAALLVASPALASGDVFHGWSKDGTWLVFERPGRNDVSELFFCPTGSAPPKWPAMLDELDRLPEAGLDCVRFLDANKAPYQWRKLVSPGDEGPSSKGLSLSAELVTDGETPGWLIEGSGKPQLCPASGLRDTSKVQRAFWHPSLRSSAVIIDGTFHHCAVTVRPGKAPPKRR